MLELLNFIKNTNCIEEINVEDLKQLLLSENRNYKNFAIKMMTKDSIAVYNKNTKKSKLIKCVKHYYGLGDKNCINTKMDILKISPDSNCKECHQTCLTRYANGEINKL